MIKKGDDNMKFKRVKSVILVFALLLSMMTMFASASSGTFNKAYIGESATSTIVSFHLKASGCCGGSVTQNPSKNALKFVVLRSGGTYKGMSYWAALPSCSWSNLPSGYTYSLALKTEFKEVSGVKGTYYYY